MVYAGEYTDNPEFIRVYVDSEDHFLWGIKEDGSIEWAKGIPTPIQTKLTEIEGKIEQGSENIGDRVSDLEDKVFPLSVSVKGGGTYELGTEQTITISWTSKKGDQEITPDKQTVNGESATSPKIYSGVKTTTTYKVEITYGTNTAAGSTTATFIQPSYIGFSSVDNSGALDITSLTQKIVKSNIAGTYKLNNASDGNFLWLCIPSDKTLNKITLNGFDVPIEDLQGGSTSVGSYNCYRSSNSLIAGDYEFVVS